MTGFPRDTTGRLLVLTVVALLADMLVPWSVSYDTPLTITRLGWPALALALLLGAALVPLARSDYRTTPRFAVLPLAVGAFCAGLGVMYWVILQRENAQAVEASNGPFADAKGPLIHADIGLYLFILGAGALAVLGYQIFTAGVKASAASTAPRAVSASVAAPVVTPAPAAPATNATSATSAVSDTPPTPPASAPERELPAQPPQADTRLDSLVPLPGSPAWTEAPHLPAHVRSRSGQNGWHRTGIRRH